MMLVAYMVNELYKIDFKNQLVRIDPKQVQFEIKHGQAIKLHIVVSKDLNVSEKRSLLSRERWRRRSGRGRHSNPITVKVNWSQCALKNKMLTSFFPIILAPLSNVTDFHSAPLLLGICLKKIDFPLSKVL